MNDDGEVVVEEEAHKQQKQPSCESCPEKAVIPPI